jgi:hypothetical protein
MKGDFTRNTFRKEERLSRVLQQQGRVQLDADWNEQGDIEAHLRETGVRDIIGPCGAPMDGGGFRIEATTDGRRLTVSPGRLYVDGLLCELAPGPVVPLPSITFPDTDTELERLPSVIETFTVRLPGADVRRLGIGPGDAVKLLYLDSLSRENEAGPYSVHQLTELPDGTINVTFGGSLATSPQERWFRRETTTLRQPDLPGAVDPPEDGIYLVYLDVWSRHLTWLDEPEIRETALGGPDTATRARTVCQVRFLRLGAVGEIDELSGRPLSCLSKPDLWNDWIAPGSGRLRARAEPGAAASGPCAVPADAGFTGLENQLYRVEIHTEGDLDQATFKWSRENGSVVTRWVDVPVPGTIRVADSGRDAVLGFRGKDWVELIEDDAEADGRRHGVLVQLCTVKEDLLTLETTPSPPPEVAAWFQAFQDAQENQTAPPRIKVRRWDGSGGQQPVKATAADGWIPLEQGVQVRFEAGSFKTGDYWTIPARTSAGSRKGGIEWPLDSLGEALAAPPHGIEHHSCKLGLVERTGGTGPAHWSVRDDCRALFPPLTGMLHLEKLCGDCQKALPGQPLEKPLRLAVLNGGLPMPGRSVRVEVRQGGGRVYRFGESPQTGIELTTGDDGTIELYWTLGAHYEAQHVEAWLLDDGGNQSGPVLCFTAHQIVPRLHPLCGDGQQVLPGQKVPGDLAVAVLVGDLGVLPGAKVRFRVRGELPDNSDAEGWVQALPLGEIVLMEETPEVESIAQTDGVAHCRWYAGDTKLVQRVEATLLFPIEGTLQPLGPSVCFTATLSRASQVAYTPGACRHLDGVLNVQDALDELCKKIGSEPGIVIDRVETVTGGRLLNDSSLPVYRFVSGLRVSCDQEIADFFKLEGRSTIAPPKPNFHVILFMPYRPADIEFIVGFQPVVLAGTVAVDTADKKVITWQPANVVKDWLRDRLFQGLNRPNQTSPTFSTIIDRLLVVIRINGSFLWGNQNPPLLLDGDSFGQSGPSGRINVTLPSGDGRRGGGFEMWCWLTGNLEIQASASQVPPQPSRPWRVSGTATLSGAPAEGVAVSLRTTGNSVVKETTTGTDGKFLFTGLATTGSFDVVALKDGLMASTRVLVGFSLFEPDPPPPAATLTDVKGIGPVALSRLQEAGITRPDEVAALEPGRLAEILQMPEARAKNIIENARRLAAGQPEPPAGDEPPGSEGA